MISLKTGFSTDNNKFSLDYQYKALSCLLHTMYPLKQYQAVKAFGIQDLAAYPLHGLFSLNRRFQD